MAGHWPIAPSVGCGSVSRFPVPQVYSSYLVPPHTLNYCSFIIILTCDRISVLTLIFLKIRSYSCLSIFPYKIPHKFCLFLKRKSVGIPIEIAFNLQTNLGRIDIFTILSLSIHESLSLFSILLHSFLCKVIHILFIPMQLMFFYSIVFSLNLISYLLIIIIHRLNFCLLSLNPVCLLKY